MTGKVLEWRERAQRGRALYRHAVHYALGRRMRQHPRWDWRLCPGIHAMPNPERFPDWTGSYEIQRMSTGGSLQRWVPLNFKMEGLPSGFSLHDAIPYFWDGIVDQAAVRELLEYDHGPVELYGMPDGSVAWCALVDGSTLGAAPNELEAFRIALDAPQLPCWPDGHRWAAFEVDEVVFEPRHEYMQTFVYDLHAMRPVGRWHATAGALLRLTSGWKFYEWTNISPDHRKKLAKRIREIQLAPVHQTVEDALRAPV